MKDVLTLVLTTVLVFIVQQVCIFLWEKLKRGRKGRKH